MARGRGSSTMSPTQTCWFVSRQFVDGIMNNKNDNEIIKGGGVSTTGISSMAKRTTSLATHPPVHSRKAEQG